MLSRGFCADDDLNALRTVSRILEARGYGLLRAATARHSLRVACSNRIHLALLDKLLPDGSGIDVMRALRGVGLTCTVIILTGHDQREDRIAALTDGADDYLVKPCDTDELCARVHAQLRRASGAFETHRIGNITIDEPQRKALVDGSSVDLPAIEHDMLCLLLRHHSRIVTRSELVRHVWGTSAAPKTDHALNVHIAQLRKRLGNASRRLVTVRGRGFRILLGKDVEKPDP